MYEKYYNLTADPFRLVPDYRFSFGHTSYANAKAYLEYALYRGEGFITVTGPAGTGKTTLIHQLLAEVDAEKVQVATITGTQLEAHDLLHMVAASLDMPVADHTSKSDLLLMLGEFLQRQGARGRRTIVVVDEAQDLPDEAVEELRLLSNLQANYQLLLQVFLVGQEKLRELILKPEMEHLRQRIIAASYLEPLDFDDTVSYIEHRLRKVRWLGDPQISGSALKLIFTYSRGIPRRINLICSRVLLYSSLDEKHQITTEDAGKVISDLQRELLVDTDEAPGEDTGQAGDGDEDELNARYSLPRGEEKAHEPLTGVDGQDAAAEGFTEDDPDLTVKRPAGSAGAAQESRGGQKHREAQADAGGQRGSRDRAGTESVMVAPRREYRPRAHPRAAAQERRRAWLNMGMTGIALILLVLAAKVGFERYGDQLGTLGQSVKQQVNQIVSEADGDSAGGVSVPAPTRQAWEGDLFRDPELEDAGDGLAGDSAPVANGEPESQRAASSLELARLTEEMAAIEEDPVAPEQLTEEGALQQPNAAQADARAPDESLPQPDTAVVAAAEPESAGLAEEAREPVRDADETPAAAVVAPDTRSAVTEVAPPAVDDEPVAEPEDIIIVEDRSQPADQASEPAAGPEPAQSAEAPEGGKDGDIPVEDRSVPAGSQIAFLQQSGVESPVEQPVTPDPAEIRRQQERLRDDARQRHQRQLASRAQPSIPKTAPVAAAVAVQPPSRPLQPSQPKVQASQPKVQSSQPGVQASVPVRAEPAVSKPLSSALLERDWNSRGKPAVLLPSQATNCKQRGNIINCFSLPTNVDTRYGKAVYKVEATLKDFSDDGRFRLVYRTLVMLVGDDEDDVAARADDAAPDSGKWQITDHLMDCALTVQGNNVRCEDEKGVVRIYNSSSVTSLNASNRGIPAR